MATVPGKQVLSVSQLNRLARQLLESDLPQLWVEGEISNLARPASGHLYFSLKDDRAQIRCALFKGRGRGPAPSVTNGLQVIARGRVSLYDMDDAAASCARVTCTLPMVQASPPGTGTSVPMT